MSAALLAKLIEAGTPVDLVGEVAMELARAQALQEVVEQRRAKDRERKRNPRNSEESVETPEIQEQGSPEVSPLASPLPNPSKSAPYNPPKIQEEKRQAIASCLRRAFPPPDGVSAEQWEAFRKQRKKPLNDRSYTLLTNKLTQLASDGHNPGALIDAATESGWETVWPPRVIGSRGGAKWVSKSGYEYRGDDRAVMREAERRGDMDTYWSVKSALEQVRAA